MKPFKFKQFSVQQDKTAMKIGTDAVLLGAWCTIKEFTDTVLDIGSGTGVIALMLAQRCDAMTVDAVEIDGNAYEQTVENFEQSDWGDRLFCYNSSFQEFATEMQEEEETYECIVSNPPFYTDEFETENDARNKARFTTALSFDELLTGVVKILAEDGIFSTIIPFKEEANFIELANSKGLFLNKVCNVKGNESSPVKRSLLAFSFTETEPTKEVLTIEIERHQYTNEYVELTKDFYFKM